MRGGIARSALLAAGLMAAAMAPSPSPSDLMQGTSAKASKGTQQKGLVDAARVQQRASLRNLFGAVGLWRTSYPNGPGWTQAQVQRMARKKRNVLRNKRAHRGKA